MKPFNENEIEGKQAPSCPSWLGGNKMCEIVIWLAVIYFSYHLLKLIFRVIYG